jgi:hypothetical protein
MFINALPSREQTALPLGREQPRHTPEEMRGQVLDLNPQYKMRVS